MIIIIIIILVYFPHFSEAYVIVATNPNRMPKAQNPIDKA